MLLMVVSLGVPLHVAEDHHLEKIVDDLHWHSADHHHHHALGDHDYEGIRGRQAPINLIALEDTPSLYAPEFLSFLTINQDFQVPRYDGSSPPSLRAPPSA